MKNLKLNSKKLISGLFIGSGIVLASNYVNTVKCDIDVPHAHAYESVSGTICYLPKEKKEVKIHLYPFTRNDDYIELNEGDEKLLKVLASKELVSCKDNYELIKEKFEEYPKYLYEYRYDSYDQQYNGMWFYHALRTHKKWTDDINKIYANKDSYKNLVITGRVKIIGYGFKTYNIVKNKFGFYDLDHGPIIYDISELSEEYPYVLCPEGNIFGYEYEDIVEGNVDVVDNTLKFSALEDSYNIAKR